MPMWLSKKKAEVKEQNKGSKERHGSKDSATSSDDGKDPMPVNAAPTSPLPRKGRLGGDPASPGLARPRRMSFDAAANADMVKAALGDVNNIINKAGEQEKVGLRPRRASFSASAPSPAK